MSVRIITGHVLDALAELPEQSVHCVVTSVPYWGLRAYGTPPQVWGGDSACEHKWGPKERGKRKDMLPADETSSAGRSGRNDLQDGAAHDGGNFCQYCGTWRGEHGLEPSLDLYLQHEIEIWRAVRRVLRDNGTVWLNIGDCYATSANGKSAADTKAAGNDDRTFRDKPFSTVGPVLDMSQPNVRQTKHPGGTEPQGRIRAGGYLKPKDLVMLPARLALALQDDGWWLRSDIIWHKPNPMPESVTDRPATAHEHMLLLTKSRRYYYDAAAVRRPFTDERQGRDYKMPDGWDSSTGQGGHGSFHKHGREKGRPARNHDRGIPPRHAQYESSKRETLDEVPRDQGANLRNVWTIATAPYPGAHYATFPPALVEPCIKAGCPKDGVVLDPFAGTGVAGMVADRLGRDAILIELNPDSVTLAKERLHKDGGMFLEVTG